MVTRLKSLQSPTGDGACSTAPSGTTAVRLGTYPELDNNLGSDGASKAVLVAANCHPGFHYAKFLIYSPEEQLWRHLPINAEAFLSDLPARLGTTAVSIPL